MLPEWRPQNAGTPATGRDATGRSHEQDVRRGRGPALALVSAAAAPPEDGGLDSDRPVEARVQQELPAGGAPVGELPAYLERQGFRLHLGCLQGINPFDLGEVPASDG